MATKVAASTSGIEKATTAPARSPRLMKLTASTIAIASQSALVNSLIDSSTTCGCSATSTGSIPIGRSAVISAIFSSMALPSARRSPPDCMEMASAIAGLPLTRNIGSGGST